MEKFKYLENAHAFSKASVTPTMEAGSAGNKSAHTIQSKDIWAEKLPIITEEELAAWNSAEEDKLIIKPGYAPIKFNYKKPVYNLTTKNNNNVTSNGFVGKIMLDNGEGTLIPVEQFISEVDVLNDDGSIVRAYRPVLYQGDETYGTSRYEINASNGLIYDSNPSNGNTTGIFFATENEGLTNFKLTFFTYEGKLLSDDLHDFKNKTYTNVSSNDKDVAISLTGTIIDPVLNVGVTHTKNIINASGAALTKAPDTQAVIDYVTGYVTEVHEATLNQLITEDGVTVSLTGTLGNPVIGLEVSHNDTIDDSTSKSLTAPTTKAVHSFVSDLKKYIDGNYYNISGTDNAISAAVTPHTSNTDIHVTLDEKDKWDNILSELEAGTDISIAGTTISVASAARTSWNTAASEISALLKVETKDIDDDNKKYALMMTAESSDITLTNNQFKHPLTSLVIGDSLFADNSTITKFESNLPNLTYAESMFSGCTALTSFNVGLYNLSNLVTGTNMFNGCTNLVSFNGNLSSLSSASGMFAGCNNLSANSISMIVSSIKDWSKETDDTAEHKIGIPISSNDENYAKLIAKGWTIE